MFAVQLRKVLALLPAICPIVVVLVDVGAARAAVTYDNLNGFHGPPSIAFFSDPLYPNRVADDFILAAGQNIISDIHWTGGYASPAGPGNFPSFDDFTLEFFTTGANTPFEPFATYTIGQAMRTSTGDTLTYSGLSGTDVYSYSASIAPLTLLPSTPYWVSIVNTTPNDPYNMWLWTGVDIPGGQIAMRSTANDQWVPTCCARMDFQLTNDGVPAVPEPSAYVLMLAGLGVVGFAVRRRQRSTTHA